MALPEDHLAKFHKMTDAKEMWDAIKSRFGGNDESKKMQKYILKQQFEGFYVLNSEGLHKGYDRFQSLLSQLEIHGARSYTLGANQKFLRSLPSAWSQVSLIMRTKPGVDSLSFDDLYNNLRVFENDVKGSTASPSSTQNVAFVSENTINTNDVSTAYGVSNPSGRKLQFDAKEPAGFDKTKVECYNCHKTWPFARECRTKGNQDSKRRDAWNSRNKDGRRSGKQEDSKALVGLLMEERYDGILSYENEVLQSVFMNKESELVNQPLYDSIELTVNEPKVVSQPKVWSDAPIIEEYASDSEDEHVSLPTEEHELSNCDFHEKMMHKQAELNNRMSKGSSQREIRPVWNNVQRMNNQNQFVPKAVLTRTRKIPVNTARTSGTNTVNTARHNFNRQVVPINAARKVNTVKPVVNNARPKAGFHKSVSPFRKSFNRTTTLRTNFSKQKVNTAEVNAVSSVKGKRKTAVKPSTGCN
ncbi:hypothetical protein Tco_1108971 [Tanacetum coccineum]